MTSINTTATDIFCLTDGATIYYPQGAGRVRAISLEDLSDAMGVGNQQVAIFETCTSDVGVTGLADAASKYVGTFGPVLDSEPPAMWTHGIGAPLGFPEDFADALTDWLDWCDAEEEAAESATFAVDAAA